MKRLIRIIVGILTIPLVPVTMFGFWLLMEEETLKSSIAYGIDSQLDLFRRIR